MSGISSAVASPIRAIASPLRAPSTAPISMARAVPMPCAAAPSANPPCFGIPHAAAAQDPLAEDTAENTHAEHHDRRDGDDAAQRPRNRHGDGHGNRLGGYRVEYLAPGAKRHGDIYDAQHARHATRKGGDADREQASAQLFDLFVEQVAECDHRHAQAKSRMPVASW